MAVEPIEVILLRQWASYIAAPIWITDSDGRLLYYNESVEPIIGIRFEEADDLPAEDLADRFQMCEIDGTPIFNHDRPLMIALSKQMPAHRRIALRRLDGSLRPLDVTAIPILTFGDRHLGAMATIWDPAVKSGSAVRTMASARQQPIEIILTRHWASYLAVPTWITDPDGKLLYCNEPAAAITGAGASEDPDLPVSTHPDLFKVRDLDGTPLTTADLPITVALANQTAAHRPMRILGLDDTWHTIEVTAMPLVGQNHRFLGGVAIFWEIGP